MTSWPPRGADGLNVNSAVGLPVPTVTVVVAFATRPTSSVTVRTTVYVPAVSYVWVVVAPLPVVPSPKSHWKLRIVRPGAGRDVDPLKLIDCPTTGDVGEVRITAVGR